MAFYKGASHEAMRAAQLQKKRQKELDEIELRKKKIEEELRIGNINNKFAAHYDAVEQKLKNDTIGLVSLEEMRAKQEDVIKARESQLAMSKELARLEAQLQSEKKEQKKQQEKANKLSFALDEDEEDETTKEKRDEEPAKKKKRFGMNPEVDTSFLPDRDREQEEDKLREELRQEWARKQDKIKAEDIEVTYSYWDGSGHRRALKLKKGTSVQHFLHKALDGLRKEFNELKTASVDQLMYVKEDLIIPHHYSFYDFIVTKARGKSGPLFSFDVHEDIRLTSDASVEKDESHAGKVCLRSWYERHKHIFPASRWEPYDPEKKWDNYTISDKEAAKITVK